MAKFIEISFSCDKGLLDNCGRTGEIVTTKKLINIDKISFVKNWVGDLIHKGRFGTEIHTVDGYKHIDERTYQEFTNLLNKINIED